MSFDSTLGWSRLEKVCPAKCCDMEKRGSIPIFQGEIGVKVDRFVFLLLIFHGGDDSFAPLSEKLEKLKKTLTYFDAVNSMEKKRNLSRHESAAPARYPVITFRRNANIKMEDSRSRIMHRMSWWQCTMNSSWLFCFWARQRTCLGCFLFFILLLLFVVCSEIKSGAPGQNRLVATYRQWPLLLYSPTHTHNRPAHFSLMASSCVFCHD